MMMTRNKNLHRATDALHIITYLNINTGEIVV